MKKIAVIGAGACRDDGGYSGCQRSVRTGKFCQIFLLEHKDLPGKKILSTGNGRCNLTNQCRWMFPVFTARIRKLFRKS